ncbi:hypothetical protein [Muribaculum gordoncarteri]|uniref:hypothetical protein n=1 Tax=Muribaculum gordoncarteri TaxID=2530390 RepID=UPI003F676A02
MEEGDRLEISMPMHAAVKPMPNVPQYVALTYGPILLGMKTGTEDLQSLIADDSRFGQICRRRTPSARQGSHPPA